MTGTCQKCGARREIVTWVEDGGILAWTHGLSEQWCRLCAARRQLELAEQRAADIPALRQEVETLTREYSQ